MSPLAQLVASLPANPDLGRRQPTRTPEHMTLYSANLLTEKDLAGLVKEHISPVVDDLFMEGTVNLLIGDSGLGKTPLLTQLALAVATGTRFLGLETQQGPVLFCDAESAGSYFLSYLRSQREFLGLEDPGTNLTCYLANVRPHDEASATDFELVLAEKAKLVKPKLIIVDCLRPFWPEAETKSETAARVIKALRAIANEHSCAIVVVHHRRKQNRDKNVERPNLEQSARDWLEEAAGTRTLVNQSDTRLGIDFARDSGASLPEETYVIAGFSKFVGDILPTYFTRVYDANGRPRGYSSAAPQLRAEDIRIFNLLPSPFRYSDVHELRERKGSRQTAELLKRYVMAGVATGHGSGRKKHYKKAVDYLDMPVPGIPTSCP